MFRRTVRQTALIGALFLGTQSALAHHSVSANFDRQAPRDITGTVTAYHLRNPHSQLEVDVVGRDGRVN